MRATDEISQYSKKMQSALNREYRKMYRNLNGMRMMERLPQVVVVIDPNKEKNAITEARKLGLTTVALIDTDCNPDFVDLPIPGNDDSIRSIELVAKHMADAIIAGYANAAAAEKNQVKTVESEEASTTDASPAEPSSDKDATAQTLDGDSDS